MTEKITVQDSLLSILGKMSEGNPGAMSVCSRIIQEGSKIDPDCAFPGIGPLLCMDSLNIRGSRIWMLYKDVCNEDLITMLGVLRANQLGFLSANDLNFGIDNYGQEVRAIEMLAKVKKTLPRFGNLVETDTEKYCRYTDDFISDTDGCDEYCGDKEDKHCESCDYWGYTQKED